MTEEEKKQVGDAISAAVQAALAQAQSKAQQVPFLVQEQAGMQARIARDPNRYAWAIVGLEVALAASVGANIALGILFFAK